jgi:predicted DsbA family dithiol-disulfide isomerase
MIGPAFSKISAPELLGSVATLQVDVIADLVCPWSFLGKKRLDDALAAVYGPSVVTWYPFQINPAMPGHGMPLAIDELVVAGREQGIDFRFDRITHVPNTLNAHRIMNLAEQQNADTSLLAESILRSFFARGLDISDPDVLAELAAEVGLGTPEILATLEDERSKHVVLTQEAQVRQSGVTGVPDFLVNKRLFVIGPQSTENLVSVFDRVMFGEESDLPVSPTVH